MAERIDIYNRKISTRKKSLMNWKIPYIEKQFILRFLEELELGQVNKGKKISESRQSKYLDILKIPLHYFGKACEKLELSDIEKFEKDLSSGKIKTIKGTPYKPSSRSDIRRGLRIYLKWRLGEERANKLAGWLDTRDIKRTPDYLKESQVEKLYKGCRSSHERFLIAVLFDSGARAGEFHNIRYEDIQLPKENENYVKITLKQEYSKTKGRVISLYWKNSIEAVKEFIKEREIEGIRNDEVVYNRTYDSTRFFLLRLGKKILKRNIHFHLFRHSSATYYAAKLNRQQLCYRYGWKFSSDMPDIYISRAGMENNELDEKFTSTTIEEMKVKLEKQQQQNQLIKEKQELLETELEERKKLDPVLNKILEHVNILDTLVDKQILLEVA